MMSLAIGDHSPSLGIVPLSRDCVFSSLRQKSQPATGCKYYCVAWWGSHFWLQPPFRAATLMRRSPSSKHHLRDEPLRAPAAALGRGGTTALCHVPLARHSSCKSGLPPATIDHREGVRSHGS